MRSELLLSDSLPELLAQAKAAENKSQQPFGGWALQVPEAKTGTLDFDRFPFQRELYGEGAAEREAVIVKATQVGVSAFLLRWAMYWADIRAMTSLYVFPKRAQMYDFADARIKSAILASEYLRQRISPGYVNNKGLKRIGLGYLYCRGSESKDDLQSIDADALCLDEYDDLRPENIPDAERRISGSQLGLIRRVGVPSLPGFGIDKLWEETDMRRWFVKCGCGHKQALTWDNVDEKKAVLRCAGTKCRKLLDVTQGQWVAEHPDRDVRGYHIPRLVVPDVDLKAIIEAHHKVSPYEVAAHHNKDLGEPFADAEGRLTLEALEGATRTELVAQAAPYKGDQLVTMGVDVASTRSLHVRVSRHDDAGDQVIPLYLGEVDDFGKVAELMKLYGVKLCCIDHLPEGRLAMALAEKFPGRVYLARFGPHAEVIRVDPELRSVSVRRVEAIDATFSSIRYQRRLIPGDWPDGYRDHMQTLNRRVSEDEKGKVKVEYVAPAGRPFDYAMAETYDMLAKEVWIWRTAVSHGSEGEVEALDDIYDFERAALDSGTRKGEGVAPYEAGFTEDADGYDPGFE